MQLVPSKLIELNELCQCSSAAAAVVDVVVVGKCFVESGFAVCPFRKRSTFEASFGTD